MNRVDLRRGMPERQPGTWRPLKLAVNWTATAVVSCPSCGYPALLDHHVTHDGDVTPSLVCPRDECRFHEFVRLVGWDQRDRDL